MSRYAEWRRATVPPTPRRRGIPADLVVNDLDLTCPHCGDLCHPTLTNCEACGANLFRYQRNTTAPARTPLDEQRAPGPKEESMTHSEPKCSCDGQGICTVCTLKSYEDDPFSKSVDLFLKAQRHDAPEPNVIPMRRHNRDGLNSPQTAYEQHDVQERLK